MNIQTKTKYFFFKKQSMFFRKYGVPPVFSIVFSIFCYWKKLKILKTSSFKVFLKTTPVAHIGNFNVSTSFSVPFSIVFWILLFFKKIERFLTFLLSFKVFLKTTPAPDRLNFNCWSRYPPCLSSPLKWTKRIFKSKINWKN